MKKITFVRHAKSDWGNEQLKDIDRPLNDRGYGDAYALSEWWKKNHPLPEGISASPATRALNTAFIFMRDWEYKLENFSINENIYESNADNLIEIIKKFPENRAHVMLFGHNPGVTNICNLLANDFFDNVPTCGIVSYTLNISKWTETKEKCGTLNFYQFPKDFKNDN
jgi:phosphohistidine phosphatase